MRFKVQEINKSILFLIRRLGYIPKGGGSDGEEFNCLRYLSSGGEYPRFHLYIKQDKDNDLLFSLHLDQKKPSYKGSPAHSGEYEGEQVEKEKERILKIIEELK